MFKGQWTAASPLGNTILAPHVSVGAIKLDTLIFCVERRTTVLRPTVKSLLPQNLPPCHDNVLSIIALIVTFFAICSSLHVRTTDSIVCLFEHQSAFFFFLSFFLSPIQVRLYLVGVSFKLVRMASVKQFLVEVMLFAVALLGGGMMSPCEAQSKQQQNEEHFKWRKGKN